MSWPLSHEFNESVQNPQTAFNDPDLKAGDVVVGAQGLPLPFSGNFADVYQLKGADGRDWAVKCFTRPVFGISDRYARLSEALEQANLPFTVHFTFLAEGIRVGADWFPIVKMEWVEGLLLNQVIRENASRPNVLAALSQMCVKLCKRLREAGMAHADLQHGNVLLVPGSRPGAYGLKLIDYDGMHIPALANKPSGESGHPSYQHPARVATRAYSPDVDRFPHLAIATALKGLAVCGPSLWERYDNGDNLLFTEDDYKKPSASRAMRELWQTENPGVQSLVGRLAIACGKPIQQTPWLDELAPEGEAPPLDDATRREAETALGIGQPLPTSIPLPTKPKFEIVEPAISPLPPAISKQPLVIVVPETPAPSKKSQPAAEPEFDFDDKPAPKTKKGKRAKKKSESKPDRTALLIGGGVGLLLLLVGAIVVGVNYAGGKPKPDETVQQQQQKEETPKPSGNPGLKPPETSPKPPEPKTETVVPKFPPSASLELKKQWSVEVGNHVIHKLFCSGDSRVAVAYSSYAGATKVLDTITGKILLNDFPPINGLETGSPLHDGRIAMLSQSQGPISVFDTRKLDWSNVQPIEFTPMLGVSQSISPDMRYVTVSGRSLPNETPFKLKRVEDGKLILDLAWQYGSVHFTNDSSRILLAERSGRCRWLKLPSGDVDSEWQLEPIRIRGGGTAHGVIAITVDGSHCLYEGGLTGRDDRYHLIDGRTGKIIRSFPGDYNMGFCGGLSVDGRLTVLPKAITGPRAAADVADLTTGKVVVEVVPPPASGYQLVTLLPDASGILVATRNPANNNSVVTRYDFVAAGSVPAPKDPVVIVPKPKDPDPPVVVVPKPDPLAMKLRWAAAAAVDKKQIPLQIYIRKESNLLLVTYFKNEIAAFDLKTGEKRAGFEGLLIDDHAGISLLENNRIATTPLQKDGIRILDEKTGQEISRLQVPIPPAPKSYQSAIPKLVLSPNAKYAVTARANNTLNKTFPLYLVDVEKRRIIKEMQWSGSGDILFTADSSRVLITDVWPGQCRWFKLPSGEAAESWSIAKSESGYVNQFHSMSDDGSILAYFGPEGRSENSHNNLLLDGKTGKTNQVLSTSGRYLQSTAGLSADGRYAAFRRSFSNGLITCDVFDTQTRMTIGRAQIPQGSRDYPALALSRDGDTLAIYNDKEQKVYVFDLDQNAKPKEPPPPAPAPAKGELKQIWKLDVKVPFGAVNPQFDADGELITFVVHNPEWRINNVDAKSGKPIGSLANAQLNGHATTFFPLEGGKLSYLTEGNKNLLVITPNEKKLDHKPIPQPTDYKQTPLLFISPNGRYMAVSRQRPNPKPGEPYLPSPFEVVDTDTGKAVVSFDWLPGTAAFTRDSSRILVVDATERFRWFKLPSGQAESEWKFDRIATKFTAKPLSLSSDGNVILYDGAPPKKESSRHLIDGKTGEVLYSFPAKRYSKDSAFLSEDGRMVAMVRNDDFGTGQVAEVLDNRGVLIGQVKFDKPGLRMAASWKSRKLVLYDSETSNMTAYELPDTRSPEVPNPK